MRIVMVFMILIMAACGKPDEAPIQIPTADATPTCPTGQRPTYVGFYDCQCFDNVTGARMQQCKTDYH